MADEPRTASRTASRVVVGGIELMFAAVAAYGIWLLVRILPLAFWG